MKQIFVTVGKRRSYALAQSRPAPIRRGDHRSVMGRETDEHALGVVTFAHELSKRPFADCAHLRCSRIADVRIVLPDDDLGRAVTRQMRVERLECLRHMAVTQIP